LRQFSSRYAFDALRNLPGKELRYLRTVYLCYVFYATLRFRGLMVAHEIGLYLISDFGYRISDFRLKLISDF